jgi:hypothetical protein
MPARRTLLGGLIVLLHLSPAIIRSQQPPLPAGCVSKGSQGSFTGAESVVDAVTGHVSDARRAVTGAASWRIETDLVDLRRKVTVRICIRGATTTSVIILRGIDTLASWPTSDDNPPSLAAGRLDLLRKPGSELFLGVDGRPKEYLSIFRDLSLWSERSKGGARTVRGKLGVAAGDPPGEPLRTGPRENYWLEGQFVAQHDAAIESPPRVTPQMQQRVLESALLSFMQTHSPANRFPAFGEGDDHRDSVLTVGGAQRFLERRWGHAVRIERLRVDGTGYEVQLRGRYVPVTCSVDSVGEHVECGGGPATVPAQRS